MIVACCATLSIYVQRQEQLDSNIEKFQVHLDPVFFSVKTLILLLESHLNCHLINCWVKN